MNARSDYQLTIEPYLILRPLCFRASLGRSHESANDGLDPVEKRQRAERPRHTWGPTYAFHSLRMVTFRTIGAGFSRGSLSSRLESRTSSLRASRGPAQLALIMDTRAQNVKSIMDTAGTNRWIGCQ